MQRHDRDIAEDLGDFTATPRLLIISAFAVIGAVGAYVALALLTLIGLFTNLFFFQRFSTELLTPQHHTLNNGVVQGPNRHSAASAGQTPPHVRHTPRNQRDRRGAGSLTSETAGRGAPDGMADTARLGEGDRRVDAAPGGASA
jgi:hypothetical protein